MIKRQNYYASIMSDDYEKLRKLLDEGYVVVCFVNYHYDTGGRKILFRDVAKAKNKDCNPISKNYGYIVEARGIIYLDWDRKMKELRDVSFEQMCEEIGLEFIDHAEY